jgi:hypothetical protein
MTEGELLETLEKTQAELAAAQAELVKLRAREALVIEAQDDIEKLRETSARVDATIKLYDGKLRRMEEAVGETEKKMTFIESRSFLGINWLFFAVNVCLALFFIAASAHSCH